MALLIDSKMTSSIGRNRGGSDRCAGVSVSECVGVCKCVRQLWLRVADLLRRGHGDELQLNHG